MHAATASSVSGSSHASSGPTQIVQKSRRHSRSNSLSSASIVTVKRPGSLASSNASARNSAAPARSRSPASPDIPAVPRHVKRDHASQEREHRRRKSGVADSAPQVQGLDGGMENLNRWSQSTGSSAASAGHTRAKSSSGTVFYPAGGQQYKPKSHPRTVINHSPRASPQPKKASQNGSSLRRTSRSPSASSPRQSKRLNPSVNALPPLHITPALTDPNDTESPSTTQTIVTPSTQSEYATTDYFGGDDESSPQSAAKGKHRPRARERSEKDKKSMLSKALQKANTAVLLDNAQNYEGALEAYSDACDLLQLVMDRTSGDEDKRKLDAIRVTYSNRIEELWQLAQSRPSTSDEKNLPARPMSDDSIASLEIGSAYTSLSPSTAAVSPNEAYTHQPALEAAPTAVASALDSRPGSKLEISNGMQAREGASHATGFLDTGSGQLKTTTVHLPAPQQGHYMPAPLSPRRQPSPQSQGQTEDRVTQHPAAQVEDGSGQDRPDSSASVSWLNTIDESESSRASSVHSISSQQGMRRKHIKNTSGGTDPDFDVAFDAAVEAAYDEGFEPDLDAHQKGFANHHEYDHAETTPVAKPDAHGLAFQATGAANLDAETDDEAEERILDEITQDFSQGFNFDLRSKSALPRQSDSSGYSRSTWQSSQASVDRTTAASSLSTVAEDGLASHLARTNARTEEPALPPLTAPPASALPPPPGAATVRTVTVRSRRLSGQIAKPLKIETTTKPDIRKRASTFHHATSPFEEKEEAKAMSENEGKLPTDLRSTKSDTPHDNLANSTPSLQLPSTASDQTRPATAMGFHPSHETETSDARNLRPAFFRKNKSSISLRENTEHTILLASPDLDPSPIGITPMSSTFINAAATKRNQNVLASQRTNLPSFVQNSLEGQQGLYLFDTSLTANQSLLSPRSPNPTQPSGLEPCPESFLLRPFWIMRALASTLTHPRGGFITTRLFVPREVWQTRGVKLKLIEDKVANCDLLTAALGRLAGVDTYDADAVMEELQNFESVMERVQTMLTKKLGSDVGVHGAAASFKDAPPSSMSPTSGANNNNNNVPAVPSMPNSETFSSDRSIKSNSGKSYLTSWRKLRSKSSGAPLNHMTAASTGNAAGGGPGAGNGKPQHTMSSVPMTSFVPVERRGNKREARNTIFDGPNKEYMESLARLFDGVQILDQIARQVEDPGLRHSSQTHVGLELSIRHAAEFFGFYICRFVLADLGTLVDKFVKRGSEWVLV